MSKERLDLYLFNKGFFKSRENAKANILAGNVIINERVITKPGTVINPENELIIRIKEKEKYISRGGLKLEKALEIFEIDVKDKVVIDVGSSTGGFTDVLLQYGAAFVYAVDVGTNQLDYRLRTDKRVFVREKTNARYLEKSMFDKPIDLAVIDVSFISLTKIIVPVCDVLSKREVVALVKPQFEVGDTIKDFDGIVRKNEDHKRAIDKIRCFLIHNGFELINQTESPIKGPKGNREFLIHFV